MLTLADPSDMADALAYGLRFQGRKRVHNADEIMAEIVAKRLVEHLERAGLIGSGGFEPRQAKAQPSIAPLSTYRLTLTRTELETELFFTLLVAATVG